MPRRPKPWYRKARRSWFVTIAGVQHNLGPDKSAAYERFHQLMRQPQTRKVAPNSLPAVADAFLDWVHRNRAKGTYDWYLERLQEFVAQHADFPIDQLKPLHVEAWANQRHDNVNTRRNRMRAVKRCFRWALSQGYLEHNPIAQLEVPGATPKEVYISPDEFAQLLANINNQAFADLVTVTYEVGCRPQESLRVEARHVDLDKQRWIFPAQESKGKSAPRIVYLTERAMTITSQLMENADGGHIFRNLNDNPWTTDAVNCQFDRLRQRIGKAEMKRLGIEVDEQEVEKLMPTLKTHRRSAGQMIEKTAAELRQEARRKLTLKKATEFAPRYSLYALRHSWATNALQRGVDALTVAILMGHKDPSTLARTYQHLSHNPTHLLEQAHRAAG